MLISSTNFNNQAANIATFFVFHKKESRLNFID